jgi:hypothetical protein
MSSKDVLLAMTDTDRALPVQPTTLDPSAHL